MAVPLVPDINFLPKDEGNGGIAKALSSPNFIENIQAIFHPSETLAKKQMENVIQATADIKTQGLERDFQDVAAKAISNFQDYNFSLYKNKKGDRSKLDATQILDVNRKHQDLENDIASLQELSKDYNSTVTQLEKWKAAGNIQQSELDDFYKQYHSRIDELKKTGNIQDAHIASNLATKLVHPKEINKPEDLEKKAKEQFTALEGITNSIKSGLSEQGYSKPTQEQVQDYVKNKFSPDGEIWKNYIKPHLAMAYGLDPTITDDNTFIKKLSTSVLPEIRTKTPPVSPEQKQTTWYQKSDGTQVAQAIDKQPKEIMIGGETKTVRGVQATFDPASNKTVYDVEVKKTIPADPDELQEYKDKAEKDPNGKITLKDGTKITNKKAYDVYKSDKSNFKQDFVHEQHTSDESDAFGQFFEEPPKGRGSTKKVVPSKTTQQPSNGKIKVW